MPLSKHYRFPVVLFILLVSGIFNVSFSQSSLEEALANPEKVYKLVLCGAMPPGYDYNDDIILLPEIGNLTNLTELHLRGMCSIDKLPPEPVEFDFRVP